MIRRPPRSTLDRSSAASDVYKRQVVEVISSAIRSIGCNVCREDEGTRRAGIARWAEIGRAIGCARALKPAIDSLSLIHISEPTRPY